MAHLVINAGRRPRFFDWWVFPTTETTTGGAKKVMANIKRAGELSRPESGGTPSPSTGHSPSNSGMFTGHVDSAWSSQILIPESSDSLPESKASSPSEQAKNQIDFQFLNFSHPSDAKGSRARRTVRSHVTKQQHQKEHAAAAARRARSYPQPDASSELEDTPGPRPHAATFPSSRPRLDLSERIPSTLSRGDVSSPSPSPTGSSPRSSDQQIDPRDVYPADWHPYLPKILEHYLNNMAVDIPDLDGPDAKGLLRKVFFPFVLTDPASLHAVMLMAASHYGNVRGSKSHTIDTLQLRGMAIAEINKALEDPQRATSDQIIAAVAKMASYEALFGDKQFYNTHMTGLLRMVSLRGGLPALGLDGLLERILLWVDANAAHIMGAHIYFDRAAFPSTALHPRPDPHRFAGGLPRRIPPPA